MKKKNRKKQFLALVLALSLGIMPVDSSVFAASDFISDTQDNNITDNTQDFEAEGTDGVGEVLASAISEENENSEERRLSANNITRLEIEDNTAVVEFQTVTDAELVVSVYDEQQLQMLASGNEYVSEDDNTAEITISGDMPQYFVATAYLLDEESHKPLCDSYTTELYRKNIQDLRNSTVDDYEPEKVLQLEEGNEETNFAVFNDQTVTAEEGTASNQLIDNGNGTYTITNADSSFTGLKVGDTFSYRYSDGTVLLGKVAAISVNGTTVTIHKEANTDLEDYFDYVKIEVDGSEGEWSVDNSNLEDGVTAANTDTDVEMFADRAERVEGGGSIKYSTSYNLYKKFGNVKLTGSLKYSFNFALDFYVTAKYQYFSAKMDYTTGISVKVEGTLKLKEIPLGRIQCTPVPCVNVGFTPAFVVEASGSVEWNGELKGSIGGAYDANSGCKDLASRPTVNSKLEIEGKLFVGLKAAPFVSIISSDLCKSTLSFTGGAELSAKKALYDTGKDEIHTCKLCLQGEINAKFTMKLEVDIIKGVVNRKRTWDLAKIKVKDFYYSIDSGEFGWSTCPHIAYAVNVTVKDKDGKEIEGTSILTVGDRKTAEWVKIVTPKGNVDSVEATGSKKTKIYLPNGSYVVQAAQGEMKGEANLTVHSRGTQVEVKLNKKTESGGTGTGDQASGKDGNITWRLAEDGTLYIEGQGDMPDYDGKRKCPWSEFEITKVIVRKGITSIGDAAFCECYYLTSVELPEGITSIGDMAFCSCGNLTSIRLPEGVTSIGGAAFCECYYLTSIELPKGVTSIESSTFQNCRRLTSIKLPKGITSIGADAFMYCFNLTSIELPEKITSIGFCAFESCESLSNIKLPENVSEMGSSVFNQCTSLKSIYFKGNKPGRLEGTLGDNGEGCLYGLSDVTIYYPKNNSTWDGIKAEELGGTNIKWIAYDPTTLSLASDSIEIADEVDNPSANFSDNAVNESEIEISEEDISAESEENQAIKPEIPDQSEVSIEEEDESDALESEDVEITDQAIEPEIPDQSEVSIEEEDESDAFESEDVEITEFDPPTSNAQEETKTGASMMFANLVPHSRYLFVMVKDENADNLLEASNLLYIGQKAADETGTVSFRYMLRENFESPVSKVFGAALKEISNTKVALSKTSYRYDGKAKTPSVRVQDGEYLLQAGTDYNVTYSNNVNVGKATVIIAGTGNYAGSISVDFEIKKASNVIKAADIIKNVSGKAQTVKVNAKVNAGAKLTYSSNNKSVKVNAKGKVTIAKKFTGKAVITITAAETNKYKKTSMHITVTVRPSGTSLSGLSNKSKGRVKVSWKRNKSVTGYRIQYSIDKKFKKAVKNVNVNKNKTTTVTLSKLKKGKTYYVRIATYKKVGEKVYSSWSKTKKIRIKN